MNTEEKQEYRRVASRADAWIETLPAQEQPADEYVASRADAWIETDLHHRPPRTGESRPSRARGLKQCVFVVKRIGNVAPFTCA